MDVTSHGSVINPSGVAELVWRVPGSAPGSLGVVPLLLDDRPAVALPWARLDEARAVAESPGAALVLSEPRLAGPSWRPAVLTGRFSLIEDGEAEVFPDRLLAQEVRKHPPSRALVDSPMLRREHWWYLRRLILVMDVDSAEPGTARSGPDDAVLAVDDDGLLVRTVRVDDWDADPLPLTGGPATVSGPAVLVGQEISADAERWTVHRTTGTYADGRLTDVVPPPTRELERTPGVLTRMRRQRALERACVSALRSAGHG
jgi:hypothetical protein